MTALGVSHGPTLAPVETRGGGNYTDADPRGLLRGGDRTYSRGEQRPAFKRRRGLSDGRSRLRPSRVTAARCDPHLLENIGTDLVRAGRFLGRLIVGPAGRLRILRARARAPSVDLRRPPTLIRGSIALSDGRAIVETRTVCATAAEVDQRQNQQPTALSAVGRHRARGPGSRPAASSPRGSPRSLGDEAAVAVARIIPISQGSGAGAANLLSKAIAGQLPGRLAFPETQLAGAGAGRSSLRRCRDFGATRTGWEAPHQRAARSTRTCSAEICEVCGVPGALVNPAHRLDRPRAILPGGGLIAGTVEPYARLLESELSRVLERPVTITLRRLGGVDAAGRARALHVLDRGRIHKSRGRAGTLGVGLR